MAETTYYNLGHTGAAIKAFLDEWMSHTGLPTTYVGAVAAKSNLPSSGNKTGDMRYVTNEDSMYMWNGVVWVCMGPGNIVEELASAAETQSIVVDGGSSSNI